MPRLRRLLLILTVSTWLLVAVGALVRAAGAGLGCPDWPLCFGKLLPPMSIDEVPDSENWREMFNLRLAWIEYVNRLFGITVGIIAIVATWKTWRVARAHRPLVRTVSLMMVLFVAQGFVGGRVVQEHLAAYTVTLHYVVALVILCVQLHANILSYDDQLTLRDTLPAARRGALLGVRLAALLTLGQVVLGTLVRGAIDTVAGKGAAPDEVASGLPRAEWLAQIPHLDIPHRQLGALTFIALAVTTWLVTKRSDASESWLRKSTAITLVVATAQIAVGLVLTYLGFPAWGMVAHLVLASTLICGLFVTHQLLARQQHVA